MSTRDRDVASHRDGGDPVLIGLDHLGRAGGLARHRPIIERPVIGLPVADRRLGIVGTLQLDLHAGFVRARGLRCALVGAVCPKLALGGTLCQIEIVAIAHDLVLRGIGDHAALPGILDTERDECGIAGEAALARGVVGDGDADLALRSDGIRLSGSAANVLLAPYLEVVRGVQGRRAVILVRHQPIVGNGHLAGELKIVVIGVVAVDAAAALGGGVPRDARVLKVELVPEENGAAVAFGAALARSVARERRVGDVRRTVGLAREHNRTAAVSRSVVRELGNGITENIQLGPAIIGGRIGVAVITAAGVDGSATHLRGVVDELHAARAAGQSKITSREGGNRSTVITCRVVCDRKTPIGEFDASAAVVIAVKTTASAGFIPLDNGVRAKAIGTGTLLVYTGARASGLVVRERDVSIIETLRHETGLSGVALRDTASAASLVIAHRPRALDPEKARRVRRHVEQNAAAIARLLRFVVVDVHAVPNDYRELAGVGCVLLEADSAATAPVLVSSALGYVVAYLGILTKLERAGTPGVAEYAAAIPHADVMRDLAAVAQHDGRAISRVVPDSAAVIARRVVAHLGIIENGKRGFAHRRAADTAAAAL